MRGVSGESESVRGESEGCEEKVKGSEGRK